MDGGHRRSGVVSDVLWGLGQLSSFLHYFSLAPQNVALRPMWNTQDNQGASALGIR